MITASIFLHGVLLAKKVTTKTVTLFLNLSYTLYEAGTIRGIYIILIVKLKN
jgi:hypothetical protein